MNVLRVITETILYCRETKIKQRKIRYRALKLNINFDFNIYYYFIYLVIYLVIYSDVVFKATVVKISVYNNRI